MAEEGERPKSSGSHDWNKESGIDALKRQRAEQARNKAEGKQELREENIDSHIAFLKRQAARPPDGISVGTRRGLDRDMMERAAAINKLKYERKASLYTHMRDTHQAQSVGDVEDKLRQHQVDPDIVRLWIEERLIDTADASDSLLEAAIADGYPEPEIDEARKKVREEKIDTISSQFEDKLYKYKPEDK